MHGSRVVFSTTFEFWYLTTFIDRDDATTSLIQKFAHDQSYGKFDATHAFLPRICKELLHDDIGNHENFHEKHFTKFRQLVALASIHISR